MTYKGVIRVFRDGPTPEAGNGRGKVPPQLGKLLEVEVVADTQESLVKKINTMLSTLDDE